LPKSFVGPTNFLGTSPETMSSLSPKFFLQQSI